MFNILIAAPLQKTLLSRLRGSFVEWDVSACGRFLYSCLGNHVANPPLTADSTRAQSV